jgi:hypothetical protein
MEKMIEELCLLLMFLTGWEEESRQKPGEKIYRAWKGYLFEVLNRLADDKLIVQFANTKSVTLTEAGKLKAKQLKEQLFSEWGASYVSNAASVYGLIKARNSFHMSSFRIHLASPCHNGQPGQVPVA